MRAPSDMSTRERPSVWSVSHRGRVRVATGGIGEALERPRAIPRPIATRRGLADRFPLRMEPLLLPHHVEEDPRRLEARREAVVQLLEVADDVLEPDPVHVAEGAAAERGEADAEDGPDVPVARRADDPVLERPRRLVHHREHRPADDLLVADLRPLAPRRKEVVDALVDLPLLPLLVVQVEALLPLPAEPPRRDDLLQRERGRHPLAE